jgi:ATPase subunit of ABC transporter with duplicated ATPase domains
MNTSDSSLAAIDRNGIGKSTLLKAAGWGLIIGFPKSLRCLYVDQLEGADLQQSAVEVVVAADTAAQRAQREAAALEAALEEGDGADIARTMRRLEVDRLRDELEEARQIAERRSGERGLAARQVLVAAEARLAAAQEGLDAPVAAEELHGALGAAQASSAAGRLVAALQCVAVPAPLLSCCRLLRCLPPSLLR